MQVLPFCLFFACIYLYESQVKASACDSIGFVSRQEWNALPSNLTEMPLPVHHVFIHHTAEAECFNKTECTSLVKEMQHFHNVTRNFGDIGYNFIVGGDGNVYVGRDWTKKGCHTKGMNDWSVAFSLMGNFMEHLPDEKMLKATKQLIECGVEKKVIAPNYEMHGHRDQVCTDCPGDAFYNLIRTWPRFVSGPLKTYLCVHH